MVNFVLVQFLICFLLNGAWAKEDRVFSEGYLGEKSLDSYAERYSPFIFHDAYNGKMSFKDEIFFQHYFEPYLFNQERDYSSFLGSELSGGVMCSNELLSQHFDEIRYSYRLITLSYLLEGLWHLKLASDHFQMKKGCDFNLSAWARGCRPKTDDMKKFIHRLVQFSPRYEETIPKEYSKNNWWREFSSKKYTMYSHYRLASACDENCEESEIEDRFRSVCENDQKIMTQICSETDEIYGLSTQRDAYFLLGQSNIINTYNKQGEALGCLRRFAEVMSHKEVRYEGLKQLFPPLQSFLRQKYQERFLQGRVFFFGSGKEFEDKGLESLYVIEKPLQIAGPMSEEKVEKAAPGPKISATMVKKVAPPVTETQKKIEIKEIPKPLKSAFLQAAEVRVAGQLERVEVDMIKLKYDYVFSLNMINNLSEKLATFMTRNALREMMKYDNLGTKEGPVPLLFVKYMIDMQEHQGLYNLISVLGERFYVSNEIDASFKPAPELIQLVSNESTGRQWQIYILKP